MAPRWKLARQAKWWVIILVVCTVAGLASAFPWSVLNAPAASLATLTRGLVQPVLVASSVYLALPIVIVMLVIGRLRPADIGLHAKDLPPAVSFAMIVWLATQMCIVGLHWTSGEELNIAEAWKHPAANLGGIIGQLCGNALYEEIIFRGFFMAQLFVFLRKAPMGSEKLKITLGVLSSSALFAMYHVPYRILHDGVPVTGGMLFGWTFLGICFCLIWIATDNLLMAVAIHALLNRPTPLLAAQESPQELVFLLAFLAVCAIGVWRRRGQPSKLDS